MRRKPIFIIKIGFSLPFSFYLFTFAFFSLPFYFCLSLNLYLNHSVFDDDRISFDRASVVEARASAKVEAPAVPVAHDCMAAELAVCQRRSAMRAEIFYGVEPPRYVVKRKLRSVKKRYGCAAPFWNIAHATDCNDLPSASGSFEVAESCLERFHLGKIVTQFGAHGQTSGARRVRLCRSSRCARNGRKLSPKLKA